MRTSELFSAQTAERQMGRGSGSRLAFLLTDYGRVRALSITVMSAVGLVSRVTPVHTAKRNCTRDEGGPFGFGNQVLISSHRKLLWSKAMVVSVAEKSGLDPVRQG